MALELGPPPPSVLVLERARRGDDLRHTVAPSVADHGPDAVPLLGREGRIEAVVGDDPHPSVAHHESRPALRMGRREKGGHRRGAAPASRASKSTNAALANA